jgi:hypothetical protein
MIKKKLEKWIKTAQTDAIRGQKRPKYHQKTPLFARFSYESDPADQRERRAKQREAKFRGKPLAGAFISTFPDIADLPSKLARPVSSKW